MQGGSSSDDADDPSSRGSSRPNSAHDDEQVRHYFYITLTQSLKKRLLTIFFFFNIGLFFALISFLSSLDDLGLDRSTSSNRWTHQLLPVVNWTRSNTLTWIWNRILRCSRQRVRNVDRTILCTTHNTTTTPYRITTTIRPHRLSTRRSILLKRKPSIAHASRSKLIATKRLSKQAHTRSSLTCYNIYIKERKKTRWFRLTKKENS